MRDPVTSRDPYFRNFSFKPSHVEKLQEIGSRRVTGSRRFAPVAHVAPVSRLVAQGQHAASGRTVATVCANGWHPAKGTVRQIGAHGWQGSTRALVGRQESDATGVRQQRQDMQQRMISPAEYARLRGLNRSTVSRQITSGKIPVHGGLIDPVEADRARDSNLSPVHRNAAKLRKDSVAATARREQPERPRGAEAEMGGSEQAPVGDIAIRRPALQAELDAVKLKREKLRLQQLEGSLVNAEKVASATGARFRADSDALLNWPARVAADMAAELGVDERAAHLVLDKYVREFMRERSMTPAPAGGRE